MKFLLLKFQLDKITSLRYQSHAQTTVESHLKQKRCLDLEPLHIKPGFVHMIVKADFQLRVFLRTSTHVKL